MKGISKWTLIEYIGESNENLTKGNLYAVEVDPAYVLPEVYNDFGIITVWDDTGHLCEVVQSDYKIYDVNERKWFSARPSKLFVCI